MSTFILAIVALPPPIHGQALVNESVVRALSRTRSRLLVINTSADTLEKSIYYHLKRLKRNLLGVLSLISNMHKREKIFYTVAEPGFGMIYSYILVLISRIGKYKIVLHHHSASYSKIFSSRFARLCRLAGSAAVHVALSQRMASDLKTQYNLKRIIIANNGCVISDPGPTGTRQSRPLVCGFLSNLSVEKGLDIFLNVMVEMRNRGIKLKVLLAGPDTDRGARQLIENAKIIFGDDLISLGVVFGKKKETFFQSIDTFLFPSRYRNEAQPLVLIEAMSHGIPIISTDQGYSAELIGTAGIFADHDCFFEVACSYIAKAASDSAFLTSSSTKSRLRYEELLLISRKQQAELIENMTAGFTSQYVNFC